MPCTIRVYAESTNGIAATLLGAVKAPAKGVAIPQVQYTTTMVEKTWEVAIGVCCRADGTHIMEEAAMEEAAMEEVGMVAVAMVAAVASELTHDHSGCHPCTTGVALWYSKMASDVPCNKDPKKLFCLGETPASESPAVVVRDLVSST